MLALNLAIICGSIAIMISFFSAIMALRSSIYKATQSLKADPRTAEHTFMIHYLGTFGRSGASGRYRSI